MKDNARLYTLDQLVSEISQQLQAQNLTLPDRRAAPLPDARSVRYYTSLGLLDPPIIQDRRAHYQQSHLQQLLLIKGLQSNGLSLQAIQKKLYGLSAEERQALQDSLVQANTAPAAIEATHWQEYTLTAGLRLQVSDKFSAHDLAACLQQIEQILKTRGT